MSTRSPRSRAAVVLLGGAALLLTGCTAAAPAPTPSPTPAGVRFQRLDAADPVVVAQSTAADRAIAASRAFFAGSPGAVLAPDGDRAAQQAAARVAEARHVPLLLLPAAAGSAGPSSSGAPSASATSSASSTSTASASSASQDPALAAVQQELHRLGATWVASATAVRLDGLRRVALDAAPAVPAPDATASIAVGANQDADTASLATAQAAGADVIGLSGGAAVPNGSAQVVDAMAKAKSDPVVLIGSAYARTDAKWAVAAARSGWQYPGGGQVPFVSDRLFIALYGTPSDGVLGVLGQQSEPATIDRVKGLVSQYAALTSKHVAPMFEIIATVASGSPTDNHDYSSDIDPKSLLPYIQKANAAGIPVIIDLQPGRSTFLSQAKEYESLLKLPGVGLALDPEWRLGPHQVPLVQIGRVSAAEVNETSSWLAQLVRDDDLPPKPFVLHQFRLTMLQDRSQIVVDRPELDTMIHVDGQGTQPDKQATWAAIRAGAPNVAWGWKNFLKKDEPVLTPKQTIDEVHPTPNLISYQ